MDKKAAENYRNEWSKQNMKSISFRYKTEFVQEFREACEKLGLKQSDVIRQTMKNIIEQAKGL